MEERIKDLSGVLYSEDKWILSGSLCGWGDVFIPLFDLVVFLYIPPDIRMERLSLREHQRYGEDINRGGMLFDSHVKFMDWASQYDSGDMDIRSKKLHDAWLSSLPCKVIRIEEVMEIEKKVRIIEDTIQNDKLCEASNINSYMGDITEGGDIIKGI